MTERQKKVGFIEDEARAANELKSVQSEQANMAPSERIEVVCECGDRSCKDPISMSVSDYERVRSVEAQFVIISGHQLPDCENVVAECEGYMIVKKFGDAAKAAREAGPRAHLLPCRILLVDDMKEIRYLMRMLLAGEPSCLVVGEATNGAEALELAEEFQPEMIVLDLEMPVMDGWHALPRLREIAPTPHIIVFSSTDVDSRLEKRLVNLGANEYIRKGGDPTQVIRAIREIARAGQQDS